MPLLTIANVRHRYGTQVVLDGATLTIEPGEKIGLVGRNGSGKTTLMRAMLGQLQPDEGSVMLQRGARAGYLSQDPRLEPGDTLRDAAEGAFAELHDLHRRLHEVYEEMATAEGDALERLMKRQARLESEIEAAGGYAIDHRIDATLHGLGFDDAQFGTRVGVLSGGQKARLGLARLLLEAPDLLLLDEPTNHLDIDGRQWLETFLADEFPGAVVVVSHDRWLLDRVVHRIVEVERGQIREYPGNYAKYVELRRERQLTVARVYEKQVDRIRQEKQFIDRYKAGQRAKQARGRQSRLERFVRDEMVERPQELETMRLKLPKAPRSGEQVTVAEGITKRYGEQTIFEDFSLAVGRGDRIGVIGPNGAGKTTLLRCLLGDLEPDAGEIRLGSRVSVGYFRQSQDHIDPTVTIWQYLQSVIVALDGGVRASEQQARDLAGAFLFSGGDQEKVIGTVSGGERSRAVLAGLVAGAHNLLVLDEPSNHLDIPSAERLEQSLSPEGGYDGALLLITHDRALLEATCDRLVVFEADQGPRLFEGRYSDWLRRVESERRLVAEAEAESKRQAAASARPAPKPKPAPKPDAPRGPFAKLTLAALEKRIVETETRLAQIDLELADPEVWSDAERSRALTTDRAALGDELVAYEEEWGRRAEG